MLVDDLYLGENLNVILHSDQNCPLNADTEEEIFKVVQMVKMFICDSIC